MQYEWVIGLTNERDDRGKSILAHANLGLGYVVLNPQREKGELVKYAFKRPLVGPTPHHLVLATAMQADRLERKAGAL